MNFAILKELINEVTEVDPRKITINAKLSNFDFDEVDALELSVLIEERFNQFINERDIMKLSTLKELLGVLGWKK